MENYNEEILDIKKSRSKLNLTLPDNYKELDSLEKRRAYQRAYCKSRYVSKANPDVKRGRPPKPESEIVRPSKMPDCVKEYNKKYFAKNKEILDPINIANQKRIRHLKKAEKLNAIRTEAPKQEAEVPKLESEVPDTESNDKYVVTNMYMIIQVNKK